MKHLPILVATDFSDVVSSTIEYAKKLAKILNTNLVLVHALDGKSTAHEAQTKLDERVAEVESSGVNCMSLLKEGSIYEVLPKLASADSYSMFCVATHGVKGLKQTLWGANIYKLVRQISIPTLVIQENSNIEAQAGGPIICPVGFHDHYMEKVEAASLLAQTENNDIHIYQIDRPGLQGEDKINQIKKQTAEYLDKAGRTFRVVKEENHSPSVGFARQTLEYAAKVKASAIAIVTEVTNENQHFGKLDKETLLTNDLGIPVVCVS